MAGFDSSISLGAHDLLGPLDTASGMEMEARSELDLSPEETTDDDVAEEDDDEEVALPVRADAKSTATCTFDEFIFSTPRTRDKRRLYKTRNMRLASVASVASDGQRRAADTPAIK